MKITECLCDMCEKVNDHIDDEPWIIIKDQYKVKYHFCSWACCCNFCKGMDIYEDGLKKREAIGIVNHSIKLKLIK